MGQHAPPICQKFEAVSAAVLAVVLAVAGAAADGECYGRRGQAGGALLWGQEGQNPG